MSQPEYLMAQADALHLPFSSKSVDLVFGSPPYVNARLYLEDGKDLGIARGLAAWVEWMLAVTAECLRVSRGAVVWVAAGKTEDRNYWPACEGLMWEWHKRGGHAYRPCYWHRVGIPGSGGDQWFRADVEYVMCFKRPGPLPWADNTVMGHAPICKPSGTPSHRLPNGTRANLVNAAKDGKTLVRVTRRKSGSDVREDREYYIPPVIANPGNMVHTVITKPRPGMHSQESSVYEPPAVANPGNVIKTTVGGGQMGDDAAHGSEAPFPEALAAFFVRSLCPPGGTVLDPFAGSATTVAVARKHDRLGIGLDLRRSQCLLGARRVAGCLDPVSRLDPPPPRRPARGQLTLFEGEDP